MKVLAHVFNTWVIANFLHTVCWVIISAWDGNLLEVQWIIFIFFYTLFFSIPAFGLAWASLNLILLFAYSWHEKFFIWYVFAIISIILSICFLSIVLSKSFNLKEELAFFIPGIIATILSISVRYKSFRKLTISQNKN